MFPMKNFPVQYARFKVFVAPVWQESFGQVVPFAMSMGLAVAGNRVGALPEILGDTGTLGATPDELVSHILRLLESRHTIDAVGARNRSIARSNFSVKRMAVAYLDLYKTHKSRSGRTDARLSAGRVFSVVSVVSKA